MFVTDAPPLGAWYNNWDDLKGDIARGVQLLTQSGNAGGPLSTTRGFTPQTYSGQLPNGWYVMSPAAQQAWLDANANPVVVGAGPGAGINPLYLVAGVAALGLVYILTRRR